MDVLQAIDAEGILTITLNRPDKLNALNGAVLQTLLTGLQSAKTDPNVRAVLITGQGKAFCAGADINRLAECDAQSGYDFARFGQAVFNELENLGKPSLAAVNGYAFGGGFELALAATFRIASVHAQFGLPEVKLGVIPGYGGTQRVLRMVGKSRALELCLTGRFLDAKTAKDWGLVMETVDADVLLDKAKSHLKQVLQMAPLAVRSVMAVLQEGADMDLARALQLEALYFAKVCASADKKEGVSAFLEKRAPVFKGL